MHSVVKQAALWGLAIGLANLVWLYVAYFLGLHTSGIWIFQVFMLLWLALSIAGYIAALRAIKRQHPALGYFGGLGAWDRCRHCFGRHGNPRASWLFHGGESRLA